MNKRDHFEVGTKIVGMLFIIGGILYWFSIILINVLIIKIMGPLSPIKLDGHIKVLDSFFIIQGVVPFLIGMYLMKSNNIFVRFAYPKEEKRIEIEDVHETKILGNIKEYETENDDELDYGKCPMCGSELLKRKIPKGPHMGKEIISCIKFPECKYVKPYKDNRSDKNEDLKWAPKGFKK